ncbi:MAG: type II secretion system F family protein, partial [Candidatus Pacebacteria bacterium]|nr:type II secretion system F family protein [Candidatus Paceibacterota bacterium]
MTFHYKAVTNTGEKKEGDIDAANKDLAIAALQRRGFIVVSIKGAEEKSFLQRSFFESVPEKDIVIASRQISTLFEAQVSALKAFTLLANNAENPLLKRKLLEVTDDIQAGMSISNALGKHQDVFSDFYVNMVKSGEESGKLSQVFAYLADYLDRQYELNAKTKNALIYPGFVVGIFFAVMTLMFTMVIPKLGAIIMSSGTEIPIYTKIILAISAFFVDYGIFVLILIVIGVAYVWRLTKTETGKNYIDNLRLSVPVFGPLYTKLYLSRIADNMDTMLASGISIVRALEITSKVVGSKVYRTILEDCTEQVKAGKSFSDALAKHPHVPQIMVQMMKVGEET